MKSARLAYIDRIIVVAAIAALAHPQGVGAAAGSPQICSPGQTCEIGEFLYDDEYIPITAGATCDVTSRYPDDSLFLDNQALAQSAQSDGWYSHEFTAPTTTGHYRSDLCCTISGEKLCLDKSFEVKTGTSGDDIASSVWGHSSRTLTGFGTLVADIWNNATRTITGSSPDDTHATKTQANAIQATLNDARAALEKLVNKPIIINSIEEKSDEDLALKLKNTRAMANQLYANASHLKNKTSSGTTGNIYDISDLLGERGDSSSDATILGQINWLKTEWDFQVLREADKKALDLKILANSISRASNNTSDMRKLATGAKELADLIGEVSDKAPKQTLFVQITEVENLAAAINKSNADIDNVLADWNSKSDTQKKIKVQEYTRVGLTLNRLPSVRSLFSSLNLNTDRDLKNNLLGLKGLLIANQRHLAKKADIAFSNTWLEEGSLVFKSLVTNPSTLISQTVDIEYYLPAEVKEESIIELDEGLELSYDAEKDLYFVKGSYTLKPSQSKTVNIRVEDLWVINTQEVDSLRKQAEDLAKPLEKTAFFAQGTVLKSDIDVSLDKVINFSTSAITPEAKIKAYREAQIELLAVQEKISKLEDLVTQSGSSTSLFGFIGGAQVIAVWGLIIIMVAGFVFLAIYMRTLGNHVTVDVSKPENDKKAHPNGKPHNGKTTLKRFHAILVASVIMSAIAASFITNRLTLITMTPPEEVEPLAQEQQTSETQVLGAKEPEEELATGGQDIVRVSVPKGSEVNIREEASLTAPILTKLEAPREVVRIGEAKDWVQVAIEDNEGVEPILEGWIANKFIIEPLEPGTEILINETPTGWLRVREAPEGVEIGKVYPGEVYTALESSQEWIKIVLPEAEGWVHTSYIKKS